MSDHHHLDQSWGIHTWMGVVYIVLTVILVLVPLLKKYSPWARDSISRFQSYASGQISDNFRKWIMVVITVSGVGLYIYCLTCSDRASITVVHEGQDLFHATSKMAMRVFPFLLFGCFIAGIIEKYFRQGRFPVPRSMLGNAIFASLIPMCACAVIPLAKSMMHLHRIRVRAVITFLMMAPVITPMVIPLAIGILGWEYLLLRVGVGLSLAMLIGMVVERWAGVKDDGQVAFSCVGCGKSAAIKPEQMNSALILGWNTVLTLLPYIMIGIALGAAFTVYLPPALVGQYLSNSSIGLLFSALVGIPVYICSGGEIIVLAPLMEMGLPMGHAIAFTITGNAICLTSIAILIPAFGRRATIIMTAGLFAGTILSGALINLAYNLLG